MPALELYIFMMDLDLTSIVIELNWLETFIKSLHLRGSLQAGSFVSVLFRLHSEPCLFMLVNMLVTKGEV